MAHTSHFEWLEHAFEAFDRLAVAPNDLTGKRVMELGAARCVVGLYCKQTGIDCVSVDRETYEGMHHLSPEQCAGVKSIVPYVRADAASLPFADGSFDAVLSYQGPPSMGPRTIAEVEKICSEVRRVLAPGGLFALSPPVLLGKYFMEQKMTLAKKLNILGPNVEGLKAIAHKSHKILAALLPGSVFDTTDLGHGNLHWRKES